MPPIQSKPVDLRKKATNIEQSFVANSSRKTYNAKLVLFMIWLYENHPCYLVDDILAKMKENDDKDAEEIKMVRETLKKRSDAALKKRSGAAVMERRFLRQYCHTVLNKVKPARNGEPHGSPIKIEGEGALSYEIVRDYMATKRNVNLVDRDSAEEYLKFIGSGQEITEEMIIDGKVPVYTQQSASQYDGIRSALSSLYTTARVMMPKQMKKELSTFIAGLERTGLHEKQSLGLKLAEGKKPISQKAYELLAKALFESGKKEDIFAHLFLVLDWCLMKRAENCVNARINHIYFLHDALVFQFAKSKGHQKGENHVGPWHVYANPHKPWICPVLSLARYLLCYPDVLKGDVPLFEGNSQYNRYATRFMKLVKELEIPLKEFGFKQGDLGTHSLRKGVASMVAGGCTVSPPIIPLCIRAGWVIWGVKDKYLFRESAGDQYVSRCASCLDQLTKEFAVSPPYFDFTSLEDEQKKVIMQEKLSKFLEIRLPNYKKISASAQHIMRMCFASVCYHQKYLLANLHKCCPLRAAPLFRDIPFDIQCLSRISYPWNETHDTPRFSGIPPHVLLMSDMEEIKAELMTLRSNIANDVKVMLKEQCMTSSTLTIEQIENVLEKQTRTMIDELLKKTNLINTGGDKNNQAEYCNVEIEDDEDDFDESDIYVKGNKKMAHNLATLKRKQNAELDASNIKKRKYVVGYHHGRLQVLPAHFKFPKMTSPQLITNWLVGNKDENIPPYWSLSSVDLKHIKNGCKKWNCMKSFMSVVEKYGRKYNAWKEIPSEWDYKHVTDLWEAIQNEFLATFVPSKEKGSDNTETCAMRNKKRKKTTPRILERSWKTVYNVMSQVNAFENKKNKKSKDN